MNRIKQTAKDSVVKDACELFLSRSISETTIKDVAVKSGVGEATVYRYFGNKQNLVALVALKLQKDVFDGYFKLTGENGFEKLKKFYESYLDIFKAHPEFYRFIREFDVYSLDFTPNLKEYSEGLDLFKDEFLSAYLTGVKDKSVKETENSENFYYATTHAMLELCKKLSTNVNIVKQDETVEREVEIRILIDIILTHLKA